MAMMSSFLPAPTQITQDEFDEIDRTSQEMRMVSVSMCKAPSYGTRKGWVPRVPQDFGDGGAYPEITVAQHPLDMGKKKKIGSSNVIAKTVDAEGKLKYDAIARHGHGKDKVVYSKFTDLLPKHITNEDDPELQKPDDEEIQETTEKTRKALEKMVQSKISAAMPVRHAEKQAPAQYIRYTPSQQGVSFNSGAKQRVIRMVEVQKDPMEPPKFKVNKKIPRGPPSPPAPVMHSPNRKVTVKEQQEWKIPPCISNWKNAKGYTIPLDKRLAADGRGLQSQQINENFAKLAEALYIADRKAREAVELRAQQEKKLAQKQKEKQEENLRALAQKAREERAGIRRGGDHDDDVVRERDKIREERHRDRQRERNIARAAPDKRNKLQRERERDVSEKIALGMPGAGGRGGDDAQFDQRLFNQNKGMDSGFGAGEDESYNVYSEPWRKDQNVAQSIYRPSKNIDKDIYGDDLEALMKNKRFVPGKEFEGTDRTRRRDGPVQFEKEEEEDPFGLDKFLSQAKEASKRPNVGGRSKDYDYDSRSKKRREY
ncbi:SNW domain-containing protein 1-like [Saccoglossus kowalevskii]|uniref:SNW domain-containing protein 1-like n=1 Tax=Saccoglossus kowalevskii TaxID=10224 RepID=A0ABM0H0B0_SACKO|nr:PREDICTED: SNW domain-containing protein 1-like [Saccoglossus kowalevskii]